MSLSDQQPDGRVHISDIALGVRRDSSKTLNHVVLKARDGDFKREIPVNVTPGGVHKEVFNPVPELSVRDQLSLLIHYRSRTWFFWRRILTLPTTVELGKVNTEAEARDSNSGRKTYVKLKNKIEITIGIPCYSAPTTDVSLLSVTHEILNICPRFRLLIIGNTGVGKSSLIRKVFGVRDVDVSNASRGQADIDQELVAAENGLFVLHDSLGLEAAESGNAEKIKCFIRDRQKMGNLKDRLHAVWICIAVPYAGGRLLEAGMEAFLRDRKEVVGDVPIVVVLTKVDMLDRFLLRRILETGAVENLAEAKRTMEVEKSNFLDKHCMKPLLRAAGEDIPRVVVSTESGFGLEHTIPELVKVTTSEIEKYVRADPSYAELVESSSIGRDAPFYIAGMAQRASIEEKVDHTVALGKERYWKNLGASLKFSETKVKEYILVIHEDVIQEWNFNDEEKVLHGDDFKAALLDTSNLGVRHVQDPHTALNSFMPVISTLAPLIANMYGAVFVLPVVGAAIFVQLCYEVYKSSQSIAKRFMAYIVDLIYVMKILFVLVPNGPVTSDDVGFALKVYERSTYRDRVHSEIREFSASLAIMPGGRDVVMDKIEMLIRRFNISDQEVAELRTLIRAAASQGSNSSSTNAQATTS